MALTSTARDFLRPTPAWYAVGAAVALTVVGVMAIHTAEADAAAKQLQWVPISLLAMLVCMLPHPRWISYLAYPLCFFVLALLVLLILPGVPRTLVPVRNGATSWINLRFMMFQPSELAKMAFVLALARYLRHRDSYRTLTGLVPLFVMMFVPVLLILKQPDLGTALLFAPTLFIVLVAVGAKLRHLLGLVGIGAAVVGINVAIIFLVPPDRHPFMKEHQVKRVLSMVALVRGEADVMGDAYQQNVAMNLLGSGGLVGYGAERSALVVQHNQLPHDHNDMIFPVIVNRWGMAGGVAVIGLYLVVLLSFVAVAGRSKDPFCRVVCVGLAGMIFTQAMINVGMTLGLLPITGITLPFVSYGGSSLMSTLMMVGLVLNVAARPPSMLTRPSFEFRNADALFQ